MIAVCMAVAAGSIGDYWINSGTHPVYNPNTKPVWMPSGSLSDEERRVLRRQQEEAERDLQELIRKARERRKD